jgi:flagellar hook assembly protein FlgD
VPDEVWLSPNYPNPFSANGAFGNPETTFEYHLPHAAQVVVTIFNLQGQKVATLAQGARTAGLHQVRWNGRDGAGQPVASGVYFYQLQADDFVAVKKGLLLR